MTTTMPDKDRAKAIIVEIIRQSGGEFRKKTNLYKAFWRAHVEYAKTHLSGLSRWPIVRMPNGPGIDKFDVLLGELMAEEVLAAEQVPMGNVWGFRFELIGSPLSHPFTDDERSAIRTGVLSVHGKLAAAVSNASHAESRAWTAADDGDELDVFLDAMSEEEAAAPDCANLGEILNQVRSVAQTLESDHARP